MDTSGYETDRVTRLETNLDDLSPEITGAVMEMLFCAGALDVWFTPIQMKKNRPGVLLALLCAEADVARLAEVIFRETSAFGLRMETVLRLKLERRFVEVRTAFGPVTVKLGLKDGLVVQRAPEYESCRRISDQSGQPLWEIYAAALQAFATEQAARNPSPGPK